MFKQDLVKWAKATSIRAIKTFAESMTSVIVVGMALDEISWGKALSISLVASILCVLTCVKGLPEVDNE